MSANGQEALALRRADSIQSEEVYRRVPARRRTSADVQHEFDPIAVKRRRAKNSVRVVDIFDDILAREGIR